MALRALQSHLENTFFAPASAGMDAIIRLAIDDEVLLFEISEGSISFFDSENPAGPGSLHNQEDTPEPPPEPEATFYFEDVDTAWALLSGQADAFAAFMEGRFRSDGYLMWAFTLMSMFQSESLPDVPVE